MYNSMVQIVLQLCFHLQDILECVTAHRAAPGLSLIVISESEYTENLFNHHPVDRHLGGS